MKTIYCDGACYPNPGDSGVGIVYNNEDLWYGLHEKEGTNNRAELMGIYHSMMMAQEKGGDHTIYSDSQYAINCITRWAYVWAKNDWKKSQSKKKRKGRYRKYKPQEESGEIKNLDIIKPAFYLYKEIKNSVNIIWIKGHSGNFQNSIADSLATIALEEREGSLKLVRDLQMAESVLAAASEI